MAQTTHSPSAPAARSGPIGWITENSLAGMARRRALLGYLFILPSLLGVLVFTAGPVIASFGLSLYQWNIIDPPTFVGLDNYERLANDTRVLQSFVTTGQFVVLAVSLQLVVSLLLAMGVQSLKQTGLRYVFRTAYFLPLLTSAASISIVLAYMFHQDFGVINYYLGKVGVARIPWLNSSTWAMLAIVLTYVWQQIGFTFIVFLGGLSGISRDVLEAADLDGATGWRRFWDITLPMLSPTLLFAAVIAVIGALQVFAEPFVMTNGGPGDATRTVVMMIYESAFSFLQIGYGSAIAVLLFVVILLVTALQFRLSNKWVFYQ
ncbi:MAG TPA: sugar ABC transporter permease [Thermomicrobiales bacterium]|nr:sugar ABC transporter permease [Thermomicrobiales bacterium]